MAVTVLPLDLERWDEARRDALVLPVFEDDRPLRGAAGLADWRLCGRLSHLVRSDRATAASGETLLLPPGPRLQFRRILWFGLGDAKGYTDDRFRSDIRWIIDVLQRADVTEWAIQLPGRASGLLGARRAIELLLEAGTSLNDHAITLLEDPAGQKDIAELLRSTAAR